MRFHSKPIEEHAEVPTADDGRLEEMLARWTRREDAPAASDGSTPCFVLSVCPPDEADAADARRAEIAGLVEAQGDRVVGVHAHTLVKPDPRTLVRSGVAARIAEEARACGARMLVVDAELSPSQTRNLEDATALPICDREAVILNVFARNASTRRARAQVELARLSYLRPRIRGIGLNMDQQMGGGKYGRGAGETASELLARQLDDRMADLRRELSQLARASRTRRKHRAGCARVALVGYTNAGKTSLMNALTDAGLSARDRPFETLDTTSRALTRHGGDVLLSDTVGFIRRLPERLFASFESTLSEAADATLLLVVLDVSDPELREHLATTQRVLEQLGAGDTRRILVFNKVDRLAEGPDLSLLSRLSGGLPHAVVSSRDPATVAELRGAILAEARADEEVREVFVPYERHDVVSRVYASCRVLRSTATARGTQLEIAGKPHVVRDIVRALRAGRA